jgi:hypothetical protein
MASSEAANAQFDPERSSHQEAPEIAVRAFFIGRGDLAAVILRKFEAALLPPTR